MKFKSHDRNIFINKLKRFEIVFQDCVSAIDLATQALQIKSKCFEAYYARARAKRDDRFVYDASWSPIFNYVKNNEEFESVLSVPEF